MKRSLYLLVGLDLALGVACNSSPSGPSGAGGGTAIASLTCSFMVGGFEECQTYSGNLIPTTCIEGMKVDTCPAAGKLACCEGMTLAAGAETFSYGYCIYGFDAGVPDAAPPDLSTEKMTCEASNGTWTTN